MEDVKTETVVKEQPKKKSGLRKFLWRFSLIAILVLAFLVYWFYYKEYSSRYRTGVLKAIGKKGYVFKTYEAEIIQQGIRSNGLNINTPSFLFSIDDEKLALEMEKYLNQEVIVHYRQYLKNLPWRGENHDTDNIKFGNEKGQYIVDSFSIPKPQQ